MRASRSIAIGVGVALALSLSFALGAPTRTGDLIVNGSAAISGSAYTHGGEEVFSIAGSGLVGSGRTVSLSAGAGSAGCTLIWLGSASGWECVSPLVNDAPTGDLTLSLDPMTLVGYAGSACASHKAGTSTDMTGSWTCNFFVDTAGTGLTLSSSTLGIANTAVTAGSYTNASVTVNAQGQLTSAANGVFSTISPGVTSSTMSANNWTIAGFTANTGTVYITSAATLTGIDSTLAYNGMRVVFINLSGTQFTIDNNNSSSLAANRIICPDAINQVVSNEGYFELEYLTSAVAATPAWYLIGWNAGNGNWNSVTAAGTVTGNAGTFSSSLAVGGSLVTAVRFQPGYITGNTTLSTENYFLDGTLGPGCGYGSAGSATCYQNSTGSGDSTSWFRSFSIQDGKGSGIADTIAFFDAGTHDEFLGSSAGQVGTLVLGSDHGVILGEDVSGVPFLGLGVTGATAGITEIGGGNTAVCKVIDPGVAATHSRLYCGSTSDNDYQNIGGFDEHANSGTETINLGATGTAVAVSVGQSTAADTILGSVLDLNATGTGTTTIGNSSGGNVTIDAAANSTIDLGLDTEFVNLGHPPSGGSALDNVDIEAGSAGAVGVFIAANFTNGAPVLIGSTSSGSIGIATGGALTIGAKNGAGEVQLKGGLATESSSSTVSLSGATCVSSVCTNTAGTLSFSSTPLTLTFTSGFYTNAPICALGPAPKTTTTTMRFSSNISATSFSISESTLNSGDQVSYICIGAGS